MSDKHPLAKAWDEFKDDRFNALTFDPAGLHASPEMRVYLENRLHHAFMAGAAAQEKIDKERFNGK